MYGILLPSLWLTFDIIYVDNYEDQYVNAFVWNFVTIFVTDYDSIHVGIYDDQ